MNGDTTTVATRPEARPSVWLVSGIRPDGSRKSRRCMSRAAAERTAAAYAVASLRWINEQPVPVAALRNITITPGVIEWQEPRAYQQDPQ